MIDPSVFELLRSAGKPLKVPDMLKLARARGLSVSKSDVADCLKSLLQEGRAFQLTKGAKAPPTYTASPPADLAKATLTALTENLAAPIAPLKLRPKLPAPLRPYFDEALGSLLETRQLHYIPKGNTRLVMNRPPRPSDTLTPANLTALKTVLARANRFAAQPVTLEGLVAWLDGRSESSTQTAATSLRGPASPSLSDFQNWYAEDSRQSSSRMVSVLATWKHFQAWAHHHGFPPESSDFHVAMGNLHDQGLIFLEPPERPQDLPKEEQLLLVPQKLGPPALRWCWTKAPA